jgi:hypothetical protein
MGSSIMKKIMSVTAGGTVILSAWDCDEINDPV